MSKIRILLVDANETVREGLNSLLKTQADMHVLGQTANGQSALTLAESLKPNIVLLDASTPGFTGPSWIMHLRALCPEVRLLVCAVREDRRLARLLLAAGASGFLHKRAAPPELISAIHAVMRGETVCPTSPATPLRTPDSARKSEMASPPSGLNEQEIEIVRLVAQGFSNRDIARRLEISTKDVETCKQRSKQKLHLNSRIDFIRYANAHGWLENR